MSNLPYSSVVISGFNSGAPANDGAKTSDNRVDWQKHVDKLGTPVKDLSEGINTELLAAFGKTINTDGSEQNIVSGSISFAGATLSLATGAISPSRLVHTLEGSTSTNGPSERTSLRYIATVTGTASNPAVGTRIELYAATATQVILLVDKTHTQLGTTTSTATLANIRTRGRDMLVLDVDVPTVLLTTASEAVEISRPGIQQGFRRLTINGDMRVAQRGTSQTAVGATATMVTVDRWGFNSQGTPQARYTQTQESSGGPNKEFPYWLKMDVTTAEGAVAAGEADTIEHKFEAQDLQHLKWGSADAKDVIVGFWNISPKSGIHTCSLFQPDASRSYVREFVMSATDQWEFVSVLFPGDTGGTINNDTGAGLVFHVPIIAGSNFQVAADAWASGEDYGTSNSQNLADNTNNNIGLAGVQLEVAPATPFEHRPIGQELAMCQHYYAKTFAQGTAPAQSAGVNGSLGGIGETTNGRWLINWRFPVTMRAAPSVIGFNPSAANASARNIDDGSDTAVTPDEITDASTRISTTAVGDKGDRVQIHATADAEL